MGFDSAAPKRAISVNLNDDLLRQAVLLTENLDSTIEALLAEFVKRQQPRGDDPELEQTIAACNAFRAEHGLLSDGFQTF